MGQLVEFPLADSGSVLVEVTEQGGPVTRGLSGGAIAERAQQTFEEAIARVQPAIQAVVAQLRSSTESPAEVHVQFGIDLHVQAGAVITAASTTANFTVALTWRRTAQ